MDNLPKTQNQSPAQPDQQVQPPQPVSPPAPPPPAQPDQEPPPPPPPAGGSSFFDTLATVLPLVVGALVLLLLAFFALNYFNIISLSRLYPKQFGFLPHQPFSKTQALKKSPLQTTSPPALNQSPATTSQTPTQKLIFPCPLKLDPCPKPEAITRHSNIPNFQGLGYNDIASGSAVLALLDGTYDLQQYDATGSYKEKGPVLAVKVKGNDALATYQLRGTAVKEVPSTGNPVSQKEVLALTGKEQLGMQRFGKWYDMVIFVQDQQGNYLKLQPTKDGQGLETE